MNLVQTLAYGCILGLLISPLALAESYQCPKRAQLLQNGKIIVPPGWTSAPESSGEKIHGVINLTSVALATGPKKTSVSCIYQGRNKGTLILQAQFPGAQALSQGFEKYWDSPSICKTTNPANCQWTLKAEKPAKK